MGGSVGGFVEDVTGINMGNHSATDKALAGQRDAASQSNATQLQMYNQMRDDLGAYRDAGGTALSSLSDGSFMNNWQADPGYQFRLNEGLKALQNSAAAKGNLNSGATMKDLLRYGQDYGSQEYGNIYNREYNRLSNLVNLGQNSAAQTGAAGQGYANAYGNTVTGMANAAGAAGIAQARQLGDFVQSNGNLAVGMLMGGGKPAQGGGMSSGNTTGGSINGPAQRMNFY